MSKIPFRLDLAGSWGDHPFMSAFYPTHVLTIPIKPDNLNKGGGLSGSTREKAIKMWGNKVPKTNLERKALDLFLYDNLKAQNISGSQDAIGITYKGLTHLIYDGSYWPKVIVNEKDERLLNWLESKLWLVYTRDKKKDFDIYKNKRPTTERVKHYSDLCLEVLEGIRYKDTRLMGEAMRESFYAMVDILPSSLPFEVSERVHEFDKYKGYKLAGSGGGGYLIVVSDEKVKDGERIKIAR